MKKKTLTKIMAASMLAVGITAMVPKEAEAYWILDRNGWWYSEGNSWATGWRNIGGEWYYFNPQGYMLKNTIVDGYYLDNSGKWIPSYKPSLPSSNMSAASNDIGYEEAKQIALNHAGVNANYIRSFKCKLDFEYGIKVYEVEFKYGNMEYEYDINASNGSIIKFDKEYDD
ncbi:PepSY domain-containing protein [uncultured Clostridium sp.]|uniref:PepSY domain-containing protein n=1 Tax=uncultured Clostridium sp. TaxID=59620 RepID=UPI0025D66573|nr:PepSY domain-containing protein [uncultured Clostridium sp.]